MEMRATFFPSILFFFPSPFLDCSPSKGSIPQFSSLLSFLFYTSFFPSFFILSLSSNFFSYSYPIPFLPPHSFSSSRFSFLFPSCFFPFLVIFSLLSPFILFSWIPPPFTLLFLSYFPSRPTIISFFSTSLPRGAINKIKKLKAEQCNNNKRLVVSIYYKHYFSHLLAHLPRHPLSLQKILGRTQKCTRIHNI